MTVGETEYGPMSARRALAQKLAAHRERLKLRGSDVAESVGKSASWVSRMEKGEHQIGVDAVVLLSTVYQFSDAELEQLKDLARANMREGWWEAYDLGREHSRYLALEDEAHTTSIAAMTMIPGVVQTEDYARKVISTGPDELTAEQVEKRVQARMARKQVLTRGDDPLRVNAVLDEAVLRRAVGGSQVMREQIRHLLEIVELPRVTLQVLPFAAGAHPAMEGSFAVLEFDPPMQPAAYAETPVGETWIEQPDQVRRFAIAHARLTGLALPPADTIAMLADLVSD